MALEPLHDGQENNEHKKHCHCPYEDLDGLIAVRGPRAQAGKIHEHSRAEHEDRNGKKGAHKDVEELKYLHERHSGNDGRHRRDEHRRNEKREGPRNRLCHIDTVSSKILRSDGAGLDEMSPKSVSCRSRRMPQIETIRKSTMIPQKKNDLRFSAPFSSPNSGMLTAMPQRYMTSPNTIMTTVAPPMRSTSRSASSLKFFGAAASATEGATSMPSAKRDVLRHA